VPSKAKPLTDTQLRAYEAKRDLAAELLESVRQMKAGKTQVVSSSAVALRALAQANYAPLSTTDASAITIPTLVVSGQSDMVLGSGPLLAQALD
jgi:hypothetical protein